jgi:nitrite reductase/ring-hydroxylating ferredoxin subunit
MKAEDYCQGDAFQAEKRTIFSHCWLPVCAEGQLASPGDYQALTVGGWGVIAARGQDDEIRVLRNACRHQNMPVVGTASGRCESFRCRFHGWTYDLQGRFLNAPPPVAPPASSAELHLVPFRARCASGLVWFSVEPAGNADPAGRPLPAYSGTTTIDIACNWKVCVEHFLAEQWEFCWPLMMLCTTSSGVVIGQIVPHTFLRTRLFTHVFGTGTADTGASIKEACERLQAERAGGVMPEEAEFHRQIAAATA